MDTVTQIALGAAVGELTVGDKAGNRAIYWGAGVGIIPDLDIIVSPFVSEVQALTMHRAFSHSLLFVVLFSPLIGAAIQRLNGSTETSWKDWTLFSFWVFLTHILLDCLTTYGTQIFQPFSNYQVSLSTIFVIDPLYTLPLIAGVIAALRRPKGSTARHRAMHLGVGLSSLYLLFTAGAKLHAHSTFDEALEQQQVHYDRLKTIPTPFNGILWMGLAETEDTIRVGLYSLFDGNRDITFREISQSSHLLADIRHEKEVQRLIWFSDGYYTVEQTDDGLFFHDLRFGRNDLWLTDDGSYIFTWKLIPAPNAQDAITDVRHLPNRSVSADALRAFKRRIVSIDN